jgi:hypothetical protein
LIIELVNHFTLLSPVPSPGLIVLFVIVIGYAVILVSLLFSLCLNRLIKNAKEVRQLSSDDSFLPHESPTD